MVIPKLDDDGTLAGDSAISDATTQFLEGFGELSSSGAWVASEDTQQKADELVSRSASGLVDVVESETGVSTTSGTSQASPDPSSSSIEVGGMTFNRTQAAIGLVAIAAIALTVA